MINSLPESKVWTHEWLREQLVLAVMPATIVPEKGLRAGIVLLAEPALVLELAEVDLDVVGPTEVGAELDPVLGQEETVDLYRNK